MEQEYSRWLSHVAESDLLSQLHTMSEQERREAFCCDLSFGTGGLRGIVGAGTNRMNIYTVRRATQGLANYLKAQKLPMSAAIAHDSRLTAVPLPKQLLAFWQRTALRSISIRDWSRHRRSAGPCAGMPAEQASALRQATIPRSITAIRFMALTAARSHWTRRMPSRRRSL